jgi:BirA family transcriptional regulator, biotin operon repressor / biotin---[acetyl-CoA-carboxylase] ligase
MPLDLEWVRARIGEREFHYYPSIDTTMREAARLAFEGCPSGTVVFAEEQTAGQGRFNRVWRSEPETNLLFSVVLRLNIPAEQLPVVTLGLGLAVNDTLRLIGGVLSDLKWPNDVMIDGKKCVGILTQLHDSAIVAGIGINVNQSSFQPEIAGRATSLRLATGIEHKREPLLVYLLGAIDSYCRMLTTNSVEPVLQMFENSSSYVRGRRVMVEDDGVELTGVTDGLTPRGFLKLRKDDGTVVTLYAGGLRPAS